MLSLPCFIKTGLRVLILSRAWTHFRDRKRFIILCCLLLILIVPLLAYNGTWVHRQLPGSLGNDWSRDVGSDCMIFVRKDSSCVYAYDNVSGLWHEENIASGLPWENTAAGDSVALVWNGELMVGYSALSNTFVKHTYKGTLLGVSTPDYGYRADHTLACMLTSDSCYVFDAEDAQWHIHGYNAPAYGDSMHITICPEKDYILISLINRYGWIEKTLIAYSRHTRTFWELNRDYVEFEVLSAGFAFYRDYGEEINCYFGAWSALNGRETIIEHQKPYPAFIGLRNRGTSFMFETVDDSNYPELVYYYYGYDTRQGTFNLISVTNNYGGDERTGLCWELWRNGSVYAWRYMESGQIEYYIYSGDTHAFTYFGPVDLGYDPIIHPAYGQTLGHTVLMMSGCSSIMGYDLHSGNYALASLPAPTSGYQNPVSFWPMKNSAIANCKRALTYKFHVYTYHHSDNNTITELVETVPDQLGYGYATRFEQDNVFGFLLKDSTQSQILLLYSPEANEWTRKVLGYEPLARGSFRDYIYWIDQNGDINIFNGMTNSEQQIPFGNMPYWTYQNYAIQRDNYFIVYNTENRYAAYSRYTNTVTSHTCDPFSMTQGKEDVVLYGSSNYKEYLAYSARFNTFTPLNLKENEGIARSPLSGDNTALVMTSEGSLYAFNPYGEPGAIDEKARHAHQPSEFCLYQNYPNPFNNSTIINYQLPGASRVELSIYNILGQKVATLVSARQPAGAYLVEWDATGFPSSVYFYRLSTNQGYTETKKLVLMR